MTLDLAHREIISATFWLDSLGFTVLKRVCEQPFIIFCGYRKTPAIMVLPGIVA